MGDPRLKLRYKSPVCFAAAVCDHLKSGCVAARLLCILAVGSNVSFWLNPIVDSSAKYRVCYFCSF